MDNIQELFTYQSTPVSHGQQVATVATPSYTNLNATKEIYASNNQNLNVQHFNYDTQWISMPVVPTTTQSHQSGQLQQISTQQQQHHMANGSPIQIQTSSGLQRAQTVQYQQATGETINVAIIQPLFIVNEQQGILQQITPIPASVATPHHQQQSIAQAVTHHTVELTAAPTPLATIAEPVVHVPPQAELLPSPAEADKPKRKPKRPPEVIKAQREECRRQKIERHSVKPPCNCKFRCAEKISEARRVEINRQYWQLPYDKQRDFILHSVEILDVKRRKNRRGKNAVSEPPGKEGSKKASLKAGGGHGDTASESKGHSTDAKDGQTIRIVSVETDKQNELISSIEGLQDAGQASTGTLARLPPKAADSEGQATQVYQGVLDEIEEEVAESVGEEVTGGDESGEDGSGGGDERRFRRSWTRVYSLKGDDGKFLTVCKAMFLTTLGFPEKVDGALRFLNKQQKGDIRARSPQRGKATPMRGATAKIDREIIKNHILSYKPSVVGRKKGQIRYLPGDLSMRKMHADFKTKYTERNVSYTIYSEVFRSLNIVFRKDPKTP